jgi:DNA-binding NarL/FixJ family response regulator
MTTSVQDRPCATVVVPSGRPAVGGSILLIEDSAVDALRTLAHLRARMSDMSCQHVASLAEATPELLAAATCVLLDLSLPDADGQAGLTELRRRDPDVLVIVLTGLDDPLRVGLESIRNGAQDYITKDALNATVLERTIRFVIERKRFHDDLAAALHHAAKGRSAKRPAASWQRRDVSRRSVGRSLRAGNDRATSYRQAASGRERSPDVANELLVQGYLYGRPRPAGDDLPMHLTRSRSSQATS